MSDVRTRLSRGMRTTDADAIRKNRLRAGIVAGAAVAVLAGYLLLVAASGGGVPRGTTVLGVDIGDRSPEEAEAVLATELADRAAQAIPVRAGDVSVNVVPADAGLALDVPATVAAAGGRSWNPLTLLGRLVAAPVVDPVVTVDAERLEGQVATIAAEVDDPATEPRIRYAGVAPRLKPGRDGRGVDRAAAAESLVAAYLVSDQPLDWPIVTLTPSVSAEEAQAVESGLAVTVVSAPVTVQVDGTSLTLEPEQIAAATRFRPVDGTLVPSVDGAAVHEALGEGLAALETPGRDARFVIVGNTPQVRPSKEGRGVTDEDLSAAVGEAVQRTDDRVATVTIGMRPPALTTEQAQALGITERMSSFTEEFPYAAYREQNIGQAAKYLDGTILQPGETFSMNETIKERTPENGYTKGFVVGPGGIFAEELGGGVSTATTATWVAAFYAGLERVSTRAHSIWISRYTAGLEATVAWGQFDMTFRNNTPNGVLIKASSTPTSITVSMWGTKQYDKVEAEFGPRRNIREFETIYDESDDCRSQYGVDGFSIDVDRVFIDGGKEVKRETISTSYNPSPTVVCGPDPDTVTKPPKPKPSESGSADGGGGGDSGGEPSGEPSSGGDGPASTKPPKPSASGRSGGPEPSA